jgi:hypothetical protein
MNTKKAKTIRVNLNKRQIERILFYQQTLDLEKEDNDINTKLKKKLIDLGE